MDSREWMSEENPRGQEGVIEKRQSSGNETWMNLEGRLSQTRVNLNMALLQRHVAHGGVGKMVCVNIHKI